jgi:16S rRNA processing protein RimM
VEDSDYILIGTLAKLHSFKGEYLFFADNSFPKNIEKWELVFIEVDGLPVPFFISSLRLTSDSSAIIAFDDIETTQQAEEFLGCNVFQLRKNIGKPKNGKETDSFQGFKVFDTNAGYIGQIDSVMEFSHNILFRILNNNREVLIPAIEEYIQKVDPKKKELHITAPEGLLNLND